MLTGLSYFLHLPLFLLLFTGFCSVSYANDQPADYEVLNQQGMEYYRKGEYQQALPLLQRALIVVEKQVGVDHLDTMTSLNNLAELYRVIGAYQQAEPLYQRALAIREKQLGANHPDTANSLNNLALLYYAMGNYQQAKFLYERALTIQERQLGVDHPDIAISLNNLASLYQGRGDYNLAESLYQRALAIQEKQLGTNHSSVVVSLNNLVGLYQAMGTYHDAEPLAQRALRTAEEALGVNHPTTAISLHNLALLYHTMGDYHQAKPLYQRALLIHKEKLGTDHPNTAISLNNLAGLYQDMGAYRQAEPLYQQALAIREKQLGANHPNVATSLSNLARLYHVIGAYDQAEPLYQRALTIVEKQLGTDNLNIATILNNLARLYHDMETYRQAEPLVRRALKITEKQLGADHPLTAASLSNLARIYQAMRDYQQAESLFQRALEIKKKQLGNNHPDTAASLNSLAVLYKTMGNYQQAEFLFQRVLTIYEKQLGTGHPLAATSFNHYAHLLHDQKHPNAAIYFAKQAVNILQANREKNNALPMTLKTAFINNKQDTYQNLANWLIEAGRFGEAGQVLDMLKEKETYDYLKGIRRNRQPRQVDWTAEEQAIYQAYQKISTQLIQLGKEHAALRKKAGQRTALENQRYQQLSKQVKVANNAFVQFIKQVKDQLPDTVKRRLTEENWVRFDNENEVHRRSTNAMDKDLKHLQQHSQKTVVLVRYLVLEEEIKILLASVNAPFIMRPSAVKRDDLRKTVMTYRQQLKHQQPVRKLAQQLYQQLIQPIEADLQQAKAEVVMLSVHDILHYLPFAALHNGKQYLTEQYELALYTSGNLNLHQDSSTDQIAAMGVSDVAQNVTNQYGKQDIFTALPYVKHELNTIVRETQRKQTDTIGVLDGTIWFNEHFTQQGLENTLAEERHTILHLATHFKMNSGNALDSYLLLGNGKTLSVAKVLDEDRAINFNHIRLLTLSACETAIGRPNDGNSAESFAAAAQENGAEAVLASLWAVEDRSTSELMYTFYRAWQQGKKRSKSAALQQAQLHFIQQGQSAKGEKELCPAVQLSGMPDCADRVSYPKQSHPYYWAAFLLMGNWS